MLKSHYAPSCKVEIVENWDVQNLNDRTIGFLSFKGELPDGENPNVKDLSPRGNYHEAAKNLFTFLREFDDLDLSKIVVKLLPEEGLGLAINDRLRRAATE
jgi:L-threonylcarbamoyladenylate synthase